MDNKLTSFPVVTRKAECMRNIRQLDPNISTKETNDFSYDFGSILFLVL